MHYAKAINIIGGSLKNYMQEMKWKTALEWNPVALSQTLYGFLFQEKKNAAHTPSPHITDERRH